MSSKANSLLLKTALGTVAILLFIAILIPNLLKSRGTFDPPPYGAGAWNVRTINTAEITYSITYVKTGYAPNLAALGPAESGSCDPIHACLLDSLIACPGGIHQNWCIKDGYRFNVQSSQAEPPYKDYWVTATPLHADPRLKNYCSASDVVVRAQEAAPRNEPYSLEECLALPSISNF